MSKTTTTTKTVKNPRTGRVLVIKRSKWVRGDNFETQGSSELLNSHGRMCCLGFDAKACGIKKKSLLGVAEPAALVQDALAGLIAVPKNYTNTTVKLYKGFGDYEYAENISIVDAAIQTNDSRRVSEPQRESRIRKYLIKLGWKDVKFVD